MNTKQMKKKLTTTVLAGLASLTTAVTLAPAAASASPAIAYWGEATAGLSVNGTYRPVVGDFTGGAQDDIFWNSNDGEADHLWASQNNGRFTSTRTVGTPPIDTDAIVGNFGGDAHEDILWYGRGSAADALWISDGAGGFSRTAVTINGDYAVQPVDNVTGLDQVMFYARSAGRATIWVFNPDGSHISRSASAPANGLMLIGRFSADGCADVYWYAQTGSDPLWELDCAGLNSGVRFMTQRGSYDAIVGQFSAGRDAQDDILWVDPTGRNRTLLSENERAGVFTNSNPTILGSGPMTRTGNGYDTITRTNQTTGVHTIWFQVPGGHSFNAELTNTPIRGYHQIVGRFVGTSEDILWYQPGRGAERLFWRAG